MTDFHIDAHCHEDNRVHNADGDKPEYRTDKTPKYRKRYSGQQSDELANALIVNAVNAVTVGDHRYARTINDGSPIRERLCHKTMSALSASTPVVSRSLELSFQSSLQLSLTVLVCYRIRIRI